MPEGGLALVGDRDPERSKRLKEMYSLYSFLEREYPRLIDRWEKEYESEKEKMA